MQLTSQLLKAVNLRCMPLKAPIEACEWTCDGKECESVERFVKNNHDKTPSPFTTGELCFWFFFHIALKPSL